MLASYYPGKFRALAWAGPKPPKKAEKRDLFRQYAQAVCDNLTAGQVGYVRDFDGGFYEISRDKRSARRMAENEGPEIRQAFEDAKL